MLGLIKCNCWILLLQTLAGLRLLDSSPEGLMDLFGYEVKSFQHLLHSIKLDSKLGFNALQSILRHQKLPFREIYVNGCSFLMDVERIKEIRLASSRYNPSSSLLSTDCITRLPRLTTTILKHVSEYHILSVFPADQVSPIYSDESLLVDEIISASKLVQKHFKQENFPVLLQNCNWFYYGRASGNLHSRSAFMTFANKSAWKVFHHSCFQCDRHEEQSVVKRVQQSIKSLVSDDPVLLVHFSLLQQDQIAKFVRWCVQLALVMTANMQARDSWGHFVVDPIRDYFATLRSKLMWVHKSSLNGDPLWILKKMLKVFLNMHRNERVVKAGFALRTLPVTLPSYAQVKELVLLGIPVEEARNRFRLDLVLLYSRLNENFLVEESQEESSFILATPIEQWGIVREHLESVKKHLHPLTDAMVLSVRSDWRLQRRLLNEFASRISSRTHGTFQFIIKAVPFEARARYARWRFMKSTKQLQRLRMICNRRTISFRINSYFSNLVSKNYLSKIGKRYRLVLMKARKLQLFSFMVTAAFIFNRKLPKRIDSKQLMLLLGYHEGSIYAFEEPGYNVKDYFTYFEGLGSSEDPKAYTRIADSIAMSQSLVPILFTWKEFNSAIQPENILAPEN